ncbi:pilus assembly protein PilM [Endozoicomonas gorgoniicola]|uniref:Pilus assembly protein PilM n=1 Tax=Endozoicomonas gorgoniicola TaxID=1234144 RepID=A0ABT3MXW3_9GAMM|nr:pilus assembly protein PilM [Endozoicomonas gorgoniicola]MCW7554220.1 pilus assembly protein PilM [Endozoicomonas gorgoniicola]
MDIGTSIVRFAFVDNSSGSPLIRAAGASPTPEGAVTEEGIAHPEQVIGVLEGLLQKYKIKEKRLAFSLNTYQTIQKVIELPSSLTDQDMEESIKIDASSYISFPIEESYFDFRVIGPLEASNGSLNEVMLVATRKEHVDNIVDMFETAGYLPLIADTAGDCAARAAATMNLQAATGSDIPTQYRLMHIDLGGKKIKTHIFSKNGVMEGYREGAYQAGQILQTLATESEWSEPDVYKHLVNGNTNEQWEDAISRAISEIVEVAQQHHQSLTGSGAASIPDVAVVSGGLSMLPGVITALSEAVDIPATLLIPTTASTPKSHYLSAFETAAYASAISLSMRGLKNV